jgi:hypothetical protein
MIDHDSFARWLDEYERVWEERDGPGAASLFTPDGSYQESPWREPMRGPEIAAYWLRVAEEQRNIAFSYEIVAVEGDTGVNRWQAAFDHLPSGQRHVVDGIFVVRFAPNGQCAAFQEWWNPEE